MLILLQSVIKSANIPFSLNQIDAAGLKAKSQQAPLLFRHRIFPGGFYDSPFIASKLTTSLGVINANKAISFGAFRIDCSKL